jgi:hypothetical protein
MPEPPAKVTRQPGVFSQRCSRILDALSAPEDPFDLMLQLAASLPGHLLHSEHHGGQRETSEEVHDLLPLGALHRQAMDMFQKIDAHADMLGRAPWSRHPPKVRDGVHRTMELRNVGRHTASDWFGSCCDPAVMMTCHRVQTDDPSKVLYNPASEVSECDRFCATP